MPHHGGPDGLLHPLLRGPGGGCGGGDPHLPGGARLPEGGHHRGLRLRGTLPPPVVVLLFVVVCCCHCLFGFVVDYCV